MKVDSNGFMRRSEDRADSSTTISIGPRVSSEGKLIETKLDGKVMVQISDTRSLSVDRSALTGEATNAYIATSKKLMSKHQFTVGRRTYDWAKFDDAWEFGAISPRFIWDPFRTEKIGMTGIFHSYESKHWRWLNYASPLSIPERGYPLRNENGKLLSSNPFYNPYFDSAVIAKVNVPINYTIVYPPMDTLVLNAGATTSLRWSSEENGNGAFIQGTYGYLPILQPNIAVEAFYSSASSQIEARIHPTIQKHHIAVLETGLKRPTFSVWTSIMGEKPNRRDVPSSWVGTRSESASLYSAGGDVTIARRWRILASYIYVEEDRAQVLEAPQFKVDLPGRFPYHRAARGGVEFRGSERLTYALSMIADLEYDSQLMSADITYQVLKNDNALTLNLGSDFFASATGKGYIGLQKGNDRFRGGIGYAF